MSKTTIEWTRGADGAQGHTVNPFRARLKSDPSKVGHYCEKVSPGCTFCYSSRFQPRRSLPQFSGTHGRNLELVEPFLDVSKLEEVLRRRKPTTYFWCDMTDMFGRWVTNEQIAACFGVMAATSWHTHQVLTKRADRLTLLSATVGLETFEETVAAEAERRAGIIWDPRGSNRHLYPPNAGDLSRRRAWPGWPLPNVWLGVSVEDQQQADERIALLLQSPAAVHFLSCEPLLGPVDLRLPGVLRRQKPAGFDNWPTDRQERAIEAAARAEVIARGESVSWVICGGESGPGARPMHPAWARSLRDQCVDARVPFFFKQWGAWGPSAAERIPGKHTGGGIFLLPDGAYGSQGDWWEGRATALDLRGKKAAGRVLDGREWNEMPEVAHA